MKDMLLMKTVGLGKNAPQNYPVLVVLSRVSI